MKSLVLAAASFAVALPPTRASGQTERHYKLRRSAHAAVLAFPPMGSRDANNNTIGFDVDYCNDLKAALGVDAEIVETPFPDSIPALISGRTDSGVASTSDTLECAKTVDFTIPYFAFQMVALTREDTGITDFDGMAGRTVGSVAGTFEAIALEENVDEWGGGDFRPYNSQANVLLALSRGQIEAAVATSTVASSIIQCSQYDGFVMRGDAPYDIDWTGLIKLREQCGLLNYMDPLVNRQVRTSRYQQLNTQWIGEGTTPDPTIPRVYC